MLGNVLQFIQDKVANYGLVLVLKYRLIACVSEEQQMDSHVLGLIVNVKLRVAQMLLLIINQ